MRMSKISAVFLSCQVLCTLLSAQTIDVAQVPGKDAASKVSAAHAQCSASPCVLVFGPELAKDPNLSPFSAKWKSTTGIYDTRGAGTAPFGAHYAFGFFRKTTESIAPDHYFALEVINWQASGGLNTGGKTKPYALGVRGWFQGTGEHGGQRTDVVAGGDGDAIGHEIFVSSSANCLEAGGECSEALRADTSQSASLVTTAVLSSVADNGADQTLTYVKAAATDVNAGVNRFVINTSPGKVYSAGKVTAIKGTPPLVAIGEDSNRDAWFASLGYSSGANKTDPAACLAITDDAFNSVKFVIPVRSYASRSAGIVLDYAPQAADVPYPITTAGGSYTLYPCAKTSAVSFTNSTFTVHKGATNWASGDTIEMPLGYAWHSEAARFIINPAIPYPSILPTAGIMIENLGRGARAAIRTGGTFARGLDFGSTTFECDTTSVCGGIVFGKTLSDRNLPMLQANSAGATTTILKVTGASINGQLRYIDSDKQFTFGTSGGGDKLAISAESGDVSTSGAVSGASFKTVSACASSAAPASCGNAAAGSVALSPSATSLLVNTTAVTANSQILLQFDSSLSSRLGVSCDANFGNLWVSARTAGEGFTVARSGVPASNPACFSYEVVN